MKTVNRRDFLRGKYVPAIIAAPLLSFLPVPTEPTEPVLYTTYDNCTIVLSPTGEPLTVRKNEQASILGSSRVVQGVPLK